MKIAYLSIHNYRSIEELTIEDVEDVLILVGRNNAGKSIVLDAIRAVFGDYPVGPKDFHGSEGNISIMLQLTVDNKDLQYLHSKAAVSRFKHFDLWKKDFCQKLPSYDAEKGILTLEYVYSRDGVVRFKDGVHKNNNYIKQVFPKIYFVDHYRNNVNLKDDFMMLQKDTGLSQLKDNRCIFDEGKTCRQCFECIGVINKKTPQELTLLETSRLMQYKLFNINLGEFTGRLNRYFTKNGAVSERIRYEVRFDSDEIFKIDTIVENEDRGIEESIESLGEGLRSIYILSLLEAYLDMENVALYLIMIEDPEIYLHPYLQKKASEILYRLSKKNQVIFSTHEPEMLFNFTTKQIRQIYLNDSYSTSVRRESDIDDILSDLGFTANDLMNVSFVFIVEGKQDKSRLMLLLNKYYSEIYDESGHLNRIAIISTNSCTNIKTYANLKYINTLYLKDNFMMIRDSDGKDRDKLGKQLCRYYKDRSVEDKGNLPRVTDRNVLILKYYSFENYFLFPEVMVKIGVVKDTGQFYDILWN
ncbi:MAG: AAA family ATPase, partial [Eubacteriales bacterium]|nr:AAA family ATPase [Eubacteriales bacterium]